MTKAGRSVFIFGIYGLCTGAAFITAPAAVLSMAQLPALPDGWGRTIGLLAFVISSYNIYCGRNDVLPFIRVSVVVRSGFALGAAILVLLGQMPVMVLGMGLLDAAGALWTALSLRSDARTVASAKGA